MQRIVLVVLIVRNNDFLPSPSLTWAACVDIFVDWVIAPGWGQCHHGGVRDAGRFQVQVRPHRLARNVVLAL